MSLTAGTKAKRAGESAAAPAALKTQVTLRRTDLRLLSAVVSRELFAKLHQRHSSHIFPETEGLAEGSRQTWKLWRVHQSPRNATQASVAPLFALAQLQCGLASPKTLT